MIIDQKRKYIFTGLPHSASSAISKELIEQYGGKSILKKHSNVFTLNRQGLVDLDRYFIFGVFRNPIDISYSVYSKLKLNEKGLYTDPEYFKENGGHIRKGVRKLREKLITEEWSFNDYIKHQFRSGIPFDNAFSFNEPYFSFVIRFDRIQEDFHEVLGRIGIHHARELPVYNRTKSKTGEQEELDNRLSANYFGPFIREHERYHELSVKTKPDILSRVMYHFLKPFRKVKYILHDRSPASKRDKYFSNLSDDKEIDSHDLKKMSRQ